MFFKQILLWLALSLGAAPLPPAFEALLPFIRPGVELSLESGDLLLVEAASGRHFRLGLEGEARESDAALDLIAHQAQRADGQPYFYWTMTDSLLSDSTRPRRIWGRWLRPEFLATLRPPEASP